MDRKCMIRGLGCLQWVLNLRCYEFERKQDIFNSCSMQMRDSCLLDCDSYMAL